MEISLISLLFANLSFAFKCPWNFLCLVSDSPVASNPSHFNWETIELGRALRLGDYSKAMWSLFLFHFVSKNLKEYLLWAF